MKIILLLTVLPFGFLLNAQSKIAVVHSQTQSTEIVFTLDSAILIASEGDYIYLPGGGFNLGIIDKSVHIFGAGYFSDSSIATGVTILNTSEIHPGAANGSIEGISFQNRLVINVQNFSLRYCSLLAGVSFYPDAYNNGSSTLVVNNCYIGSYSNAWGNSMGSLSGLLTNSVISNNVIGDYVTIGEQNFFFHNLFLGYYSAGYSNASPARSNSCTYENNIFQSTNAGYNNCSNSIFNNNINANPNNSNGNSGSANVNETFNLTFIDPGTYQDPVYTYDLHNNYHLKSTSLGVGAGTDGKDIGLYGGVLSWKDGSMPSNPHISFKNISSETNSQGILKATFKVKAQKN